MGTCPVMRLTRTYELIVYAGWSFRRVSLFLIEFDVVPLGQLLDELERIEREF
jgi:hypothetical protein